MIRGCPLIWQTPFLPPTIIMLFPNVSTLLQLLATIPVTLAACERNVSVLGLVKTNLRSTMGQDCLNGLALMHVHNTHSVNIENILDMLPTLHPRRMVLAEIFAA